MNMHSKILFVTVFLLVAVCFAAQANSAPPFVSENIALRVDWTDMAQVNNCAIKRLNSRFFAVAVSIRSLTFPARVALNQNNTHIEFEDGNKVQDWFFWFPSSPRKANVNSGSFHAIKIRLDNPDHDRTHGQKNESLLGSYLSIGGSLSSFSQGMVYYNENNGSLLFNMPEGSDTYKVLFLFPIPPGTTPKIKALTIGGIMDKNMRE